MMERSRGAVSALQGSAALQDKLRPSVQLHKDGRADDLRYNSLNINKSLVKKLEAAKRKQNVCISLKDGGVVITAELTKLDLLNYTMKTTNPMV